MTPVFVPATSMPRWAAVGSLALVLGLCFFLSGCEEAKGDMPAMPPPEVATAAVTPQDVDVTYAYVGQTEGSREVEVRARVTGIVLQRQYAEGTAVQAGAPLFLIDPAPFEVAVAQAQAELASATAREAQARREVTRLKPLIGQHAVSQREYDDAASSQEIARANVQLAQARLREANLNLGYTRVTSSIAGVTGRALKSEGSLVTADADSLLTRLSQVDPIYVNFSLSENQRLRVAREAAAGSLRLPADGNLGVEIMLADGTTYGHRGKVNFSDARVNTATGTIDARAEFPNPDRVLVPGQFVRVKVNGGQRPQALLVPQRAVLDGPAGKFVFVVRDGKAEIRPVQVGDWHGDRWLIDSGLQAGEAVIVDGMVKVRPGTPVKVAGSPARPVGAAPAGAPGTASNAAGDAPGNASGGEPGKASGGIPGAAAGSPSGSASGAPSGHAADSPTGLPRPPAKAGATADILSRPAAPGGPGQRSTGPQSNTARSS